jgi:cobalt-zinc-cadmium efflux system protein
MDSHSHFHTGSTSGKLLITFLINIAVTIIQVIGSVVAGSVALLSDALHNLSDSSTILISWIADRLTRRSTTKNETFGYKRAEIVAAFFNASLLLVIGIFLIIESADKIRHREYLDVKPGIVIALACLGIIANGASALILKKDSSGSMNIRSSYIHLFIDMLSSVAVLAGGLVIYFFDFYLLDPVLSIIIAVYLILLSWKLVLQSLKVLMQFTPKGIDIDEIARMLSRSPDVRNVHHIHAWQLNDHDIYFEAHVEFRKDLRISESCLLLEEMRLVLEKEYNIRHATFQSEFEIPCDKALINQEKPH